MTILIQKEIETRLYSKQDHAKILVYFLEDIKKNKDLLNYCLHLYIHNFLHIKSMIDLIRRLDHEHICDICSSFHNNKFNKSCPCNQFEGNCDNCYFNYENNSNKSFRCFQDKKTCYLSHEEVEENKIKWKQKLIKQTWIMIEDVLGDELYDLPI